MLYETLLFLGHFVGKSCEQLFSVFYCLNFMFLFITRSSVYSVFCSDVK